GSAHRIVELGGGRGRGTASHEHFAVLQQGRGMIVARVREATGKTPGSSGRIVKFGARGAKHTARYEHFAVLQQGRRVLGPSDHETTRTFELKGTSRANLRQQKDYT